MNHVLSDIDFTYESKVNGERSILDHFIVPENVFPLITKDSVLHDVDNFSDHSPIALSVDIPIDYRLHNYNMGVSLEVILYSTTHVSPRHVLAHTCQWRHTGCSSLPPPPPPQWRIQHRDFWWKYCIFMHFFE